MKRGALAVGLGLGAALLWAMTVKAGVADKVAFVGTIIDDNTSSPIEGATVVLDG